MPHEIRSESAPAPPLQAVRGLAAARIPRVIHQTWKHAAVPRELLGYQQSWREHNADWDYRFWTDESARDFVAQRQGWFLPTYDAYPQAIQRVDAARYVWMYELGGLYVDLDYECLRPIEPVLAERAIVLGLEPAAHLEPWVTAQGIDRIVGNAFLASSPRHPFWEHVLRMLAAPGDRGSPVHSTGPFFLTRAIASYAHPEEITILPSCVLYPATKPEVWRAERGRETLRLPPEAYAVHHFIGSWWRRPLDGAGNGRGPVLPRRIPPRARVHTTNVSAPAPALSEPERTVLIATPVKDARRYLPGYFENLRRLTFPHAQVSVAFLESDSADGTYDFLRENAARALPGFQRVEVHKADFGFRPTGPRWAPEIQRRRRGILAKSRNRLLQRSLADEDWVLWVDVDVVSYPDDVIERLLATGKDIIVPHCVGQDGRTFDLNTFRLKDEALDLSPHVKDGILQPPRGVGRLYLEEMSEELARVDCVGGTMLLVRAEHHRDGLNFPSYSHRLYIETEGLAMMAADMGLTCWALPRLVIQHA